MDREKEEYYWAQIREAEAKMRASKEEPAPMKEITALDLDIEVVRQFLSSLKDNWQRYPVGVRNRLLRLLIERVELRHSRDRVIKAKVVWKAGLVQEITIYLPPVRYVYEKRWTPEEEGLLKMVWQSSTHEAIQAALPGRTWPAMVARAQDLKLRRERTLTRNGGGSRWQPEEDATAQRLYEASVPLDQMMRELGRGRNSIITRASHRGWKRPHEAKWPMGQVRWEADTLKVLQGASSSRNRQLQ